MADLVADLKLVTGGPFSACPDGPCGYTTGTYVARNSVLDNDVGIYLLNLDAAFSAPPSATRIKIVNNTVSKTDGFTNSYQAGISDIGNSDQILANTISGYLSAIDADLSLTRVHANSVQ